MRERDFLFSLFFNWYQSQVGLWKRILYWQVANQLLIGLGFGHHINYYLADRVNNQFLIYLCYKYIMLCFPQKKKKKNVMCGDCLIVREAPLVPSCIIHLYFSSWYLNTRFSNQPNSMSITSSSKMCNMCRI